MSEKKITLEDIAFLISRLTDALEEFSKQIKDTNNIVVADKPKPKVKVNSKEDEEIRRMLEFHAHMARKYGASQKRIDEILNPTHSEFEELRLKHRKYKRESKQKERKLIESEKRQVSEMDNKKPLTFVDLEINDIKVGQLLVMSYPYHSDYRIGIVNGIDKASPFPLTIFEVKKDLSPGIRQTEIENIERIKAIIDPSKVKKHTTKYLISLAMKYEVSFDGLLYLKTTNKK